MKSEYFVERKRNKTALFKWKLATLFLFIVAIIMFQRGSLGGLADSYQMVEKDYIASILIDGVIVEDAKLIRWLQKIEKDDNIKALIVNINSPGGTVVGSEMLFDSLRKISKNKPTVSLMWSLAASGGYMASLGTDYIIAHKGTITGSVGAIMQSAEITKLAEMAGVVFRNFKSGDLKASPNLTEKTTPEAEQVVMETIMETKAFFLNLVKERRKIKDEDWPIIASGRIFSSNSAKNIGLIDEVGSEDYAIQWIKKQKNISSSLDVRDLKMHSKSDILDMFMDEMSGFMKSIVQIKNSLVLMLK